MTNQALATQTERRLPTPAPGSLRALLETTDVQKRFEQVLGSRAPQFIANLASVVFRTPALKECDPASVIAAGLIAAGVMRILGLSYPIPESVTAEIASLRARAEAGDAAAREELDADPMAAEGRGGVLGMRLPFGPFLALGCIEVLFLRRWLTENVVGWLFR